MVVRVGLWGRLSTEELMPLNCGVGEDSWESLGLSGDPTSPSWRRSALGVHWKDAEAETTILWPLHVKGWLIGKDSDAGRDWGQEDKGMTEDEMAGWHHRLDGHEFGWTPGVVDGQGVLACWYSWRRKESDMTEWLNWTELNWGPPKRFKTSIGVNLHRGLKISIPSLNIYLFCAFFVSQSVSKLGNTTKIKS